MNKIYSNINDLINSSNNILNHKLVQTLADVLPTGVVIANAKGKIIYANHEAYSIFSDIRSDENNRSELGYTLFDMNGEEIPFEEIPLYRTLKDGNIHRDKEIRVRFSDGKERFISVSSCPLINDNNVIVGALAGFYDITPSKVNEQKSIENQQTVKSLINGITEIMTLMDAEGKILIANQAFAIRFNKDADDMTGYNIFEAMPSEIVKIWRDKIHSVIKSKLPINFEDVWKGCTLNHHLFPVINSNNEVSKIAAFSQDITESKRIQEAFRESEERFRNIFENAASGMALISLHGHYFMVNNSLADMVGYTTQELVNMTYNDFTHQGDIKISNDSMQKLINGEVKNFQIEKRYIHKKGNIVWVLLNASIVKDSLGKPFYVIAQIQDISMSKKIQEELRRAKLDADQARAQAEKLAQTDYLTGLYNRGAFMNKLFEKSSHTVEDNSLISIIMVDIDHFKSINDTYGHRIGDKVIKQLAKVLKNGCRTYDFVGRYGGEEFIVCLPRTNLEEAYIVAEEMRKSVGNLEMTLLDGNFCINITASFGVASAHIKNEKYAEELIECSDLALYQAKQNGRNRVEVNSRFSVKL